MLRHRARYASTTRLVEFGEGEEKIVFGALGTDFEVPSENAHRDLKEPLLKRKSIWSQFNPYEIQGSWINFWGSFKKRIWLFFVDSLWIPAYRPEWGVYRTWKYHYGEGPKGAIPDEYVAETARKIQRKNFLKNLKTKKKSDGSIIPHDPKECKIVRINVSGQIYETQERTLAQFPTTLLGSVVKRNRYWDPSRDEYYFDRHRRCFESILYFYQTGGVIIRPNDIPMQVFEDEVKFFELGMVNISKFLEDEGVTGKGEELPKPIPLNLLQRKLWFLIEYPESSIQARLVATFSVFVVVLSTVLFCIETMPIFAVPDEEEESQTELNDPFYFGETISIIWFSFEFLLRLVSCPMKVYFLKDSMNIIDFASILPYYLTILASFNTSADDPDSTIRQATATLIVLRVFRLFRVFRIFKLSRHSIGLQILGKTLRASVRELALLIFFLLIGVIIFSSLIYYAEVGEINGQFTSIPDAFWWGIVTMTTLGYGDKVPKTGYGKLIASVCGISAVLALALPVPVFVANFEHFYHRETQNEGRRDQRLHRHIQGCINMPSCPENNPDNATEPHEFGGGFVPHSSFAEVDERGVKFKNSRSESLLFKNESLLRVARELTSNERIDSSKRKNKRDAAKMSLQYEK